MKQAPIHRGDLVLTAIPFTDLAAHKIRPAVVISDGVIGKDVVLAAISTVFRGETARCDILIDSQHPEFSQTGLLRTSIVRCHHLVTVERDLLLRRLGRLTAYWQFQVDDRLRHLLQLAATKAP